MEQKKGTFYAVSVGPGDPELMTLQAVRRLHQTAVIAAPVNSRGGMLAYEIASQAVDLTGKLLLKLPTSMTKDADALAKEHQAQASLIRPQLDLGQDVAMLTIGDVSVYSTAMYLVEIFEQEGYQTQMLAGVPSFCAVASALKISLTSREKPIHIIPASYEETEEALDLKGTKILMKSGGHLRDVLQALEQRNLTEQSFLAANCGMKNELLCRNLRELDSLPGYYTTIIVNYPDP